MRFTVFTIHFLAFVSFVAHASHFDEDRNRILLDAAIVEQKSGNHKSAIKQFKKVYSKSVDFKYESILGLLSIYKETKKWNSGIELLKNEINENPFNSETRTLLVEFYIYGGFFLEALTEIDHIKQITGSNLNLYRLKYTCERHLKKYQDALTTLNLYLEQSPDDYMALADRSEVHFSLGDIQHAYVDIVKAYFIRPFDERIISFHTKISYLKERFREVRKIGKKCIEFFPKNSLCHENLGLSAFAKKDYKKAISHLESALEIESDNVLNRLRLAESFANLGKSNEADIHYEIILRQKSNFELAMQSWHAVLSQRKEIEKLGAKLKNFYEKNQTSVWASVEYAKLLFFVGESAKALEVFKRISEFDQSDKVKMHHASLLHQAGYSAEARTLLSLIKDPSMNPNYHIALTYLNEKNYSEALDYLKLIPISSPLYFNARVNMTLSYEQLNQIEDAKAVLSQIKVPKAFRKSVELKLISLVLKSSRQPSSASENDFAFFLEWEIPSL